MSYNDYDYITDHGNRRPRNSNPTFGIILLILSPVIGWIGSMVDRAGGIWNFSIIVFLIIVGIIIYAVIVGQLCKFDKNIRENGTKKQKRISFWLKIGFLVACILFYAYLMMCCR